MRAEDAVRTLVADAPAKVNLGLRVRARRPDGYHEIESVFAPLDLCDAVSLRIAAADAPRVSIRLSGATPDVPTDARNLAVRAAQDFLTAAELPFSIEIELAKGIPSGAGLGGGSSDAGTVLRMLRATWPDALPAERLHALAQALGADVPFFLDPRPALVRGIGERIEPLPELPALALLLTAPAARLPTAEVYRAFDALVPAPETSAPLPHPRGLADLGGGALGDPLRNDLLPAALRLCPEIRRLREALAATAPVATALSGSGPTLYGVYPDRDAAERARETLDPGGDAVWTRVASTLESG